VAWDNSFPSLPTTVDDESKKKTKPPNEPPFAGGFKENEAVGNLSVDLPPSTNQINVEERRNQKIKADGYRRKAIRRWANVQHGLRATKDIRFWHIAAC
jgi:hypothetical protein